MVSDTKIRGKNGKLYKIKGMLITYNRKERTIALHRYLDEYNLYPEKEQDVDEMIAQIRANPLNSVIRTNKPSVDSLTELLLDKSWVTRLFAVVNLGRLKDPQADVFLKWVSLTDNLSIREAAQEALGRVDSDAETDNASCGTIDVKGGEVLKRILESQFSALRNILGITEKRDLTEDEADEALIKYAKAESKIIVKKEN